MLSESSDHLFFIYDYRAAQFSYLNPAFKAFFGIDQSYPHPQELMGILHPEDGSYLLRKLAALKNKPEGKDQIESRFVRAGHTRSLRIHAQVNRTDNHIVLAGHAEDITIYHEYTNVLHEHGNKKNAILNILAHDLAGPIGTIRNFCDLIVREYQGAEHAILQSRLNRITTISESCIRLIRDFLNQEFLESAGVQLLKKRVDLAQKIGEIVQQYQSMDLGVSFTINSDKNLFIEIDEDKFLQVINNLISNALKFTPAGGHITLSLHQEKGSLILTVADTGIGIPEKYHHTLFDKFTEARRSGLHGEHSTGLGMSIIKTIVEWHNGKIWFKSQENQGTTFYIELPDASCRLH